MKKQLEDEREALLALPEGYRTNATYDRIIELGRLLNLHKAYLPFVDVCWIDDNNGAGPQKLSNAIRCF